MTRRRSSRAAFAVLVAVVAFAATTVRLLIPTPVGLGDQGDASRVLCNLDVRTGTPWNESASAFVDVHWPAHRWVGPTCGATGTGEPYRSSQVVVLRAAQLVGELTGHRGIDLRVAGVLCAAVIGVLLGVIAHLLPGGRRRATAVVVALWLVLADRMIADYYISGYAEPIAVLGILGAVAAALAVFRRPTASLVSLVALASASVVLVTAKTQTVTLLPVLVAGLVWRPVGVPGGRTVPGWARRIPGAVLAALVVVVGVAFFAGQPSRFEAVNRHNQVFQTALVLGDDPAGDLRELGADPSLAPLTGRSILDPVAVSGTPAYDDFQESVSLIDVAGLYVRHPVRLFRLVGDGLEAAATADQPHYLGTYTRAAGRAPASHESRVPVFSWALAPLREVPILVALTWLVVAAGAAEIARWRHTVARTSAAVALGLALAAFIQFWTAILGDGLVEAAKHLALFRVLFLLAAVFFVNALVGADADRQRIVPSEPVEPAEPSEPVEPAEPSEVN